MWNPQTGQCTGFRGGAGSSGREQMEDEAGKLGRTGSSGEVLLGWDFFFLLGGKGNHFLNSNCGQQASPQILVSEKETFPLKLLSCSCPSTQLSLGQSHELHAGGLPLHPGAFTGAAAATTHRPPPVPGGLWVLSWHATGWVHLSNSGFLSGSHAVPHLSHILQTSPCQ